MHDSRLEDLLRGSLRDEATALPFTVTVDQLDRRLADRRGAARATRRRWLLAASLAAVAVIGGGTAMLLGSMPAPTVGTSPSPSSAATITLPDPTTLLSAFPGTTMTLQGSAGPAEVPPGDPSTGTPPPATVDAGRVAIDGPFALATVCGGAGDLTVRIDDGSGFNVTQATTPCDGEVRVREYLSQLPVAEDGFAVTVTTTPGTSWRFAIGAYPAALGVAPELPAIDPPDGWTLLMDTGPTLISPTTGTGVTLQTPADTALFDVHVACRGTATVTLDLDGRWSESIDCSEAGATEWFAVEAPGGEELRVRATADGFTWVRIALGSSDDMTSTYPSAPPIPADIAATPYGASSVNHVGVGTIGGDRQSVTAQAQAKVGVATGGLVPVVIFERTGASRLDLLSATSGEVTATAADVAPPATILASWADAAHDQVFYVVAPDAGTDAIEYRRVALDGSGDRVIGQGSSGASAYYFGSTLADLSQDGSMFVIDSCDGDACRSTIVDTVTLDATIVDRTGGPVCSIAGVALGVVVGVAKDSCDPFAPGVRYLAMPLDGGLATTLVDAEGIGRVVDTSGGPALVFTTFDERGGTHVASIDIGTGSSTPLLATGSGEPSLVPIDVRLPAGWVLLASGSLGDFPLASVGPRAIPILIDLETGEQVEMVNLPH